MLNSFQHLMSVSPNNKEIPKQLCIQAHSSSLRCGGSLCKVRNDNRVFAFTLAEVLITLVIIGVIAALTIPNLMQKYQEQATVKKVQKFYSTLSNAFNLAVKENGPVSDWGLTGYDSESAEKIYEILFKPYFKIAKNCGTARSEDCFTNTYKALNGNIGSYGIGLNTNYYKIVLDDGSAVAWYTNNASGSMFFVYDANGPKGPNQWGIDYFYFYRPKDRITPLGLISGPYSSYNFNTYCKKNTTDSYSGYGCAAWVVYKGNMDYLHCDGLTWAKHSCKDK